MLYLENHYHRIVSGIAERVLWRLRIMTSTTKSQCRHIELKKIRSSQYECSSCHRTTVAYFDEPVKGVCDLV